MSRQEDFDTQSDKYVEMRKSFGVNDPYALKEIGEAYYEGCEHGYQYAIDKACEWLRENMEYWLGDYNLAEDELEDNQVYYAAMIEELRKAMQ